MRSRNGVAALLLAVCALKGASDEYRIGYRAVYEDARIVNEQLSVSRAMTPCGGTAEHYIQLDTGGRTDLSTILEEEFDAFFPLLQRVGLHLRHREHVRDHSSRSRTTLTLPPHCFTVDFNDDFVNIAALKTGQ